VEVGFKCFYFRRSERDACGLIDQSRVDQIGPMTAEARGGTGGGAKRDILRWLSAALREEKGLL
jgi:hypothetical protein